MITGPDLTPEQRAKIFRTQRTMALKQLIIGLVWGGIGLYEFLIRRGGALFFAAFFVAALGVGAAIFNWSRAKKFAPAPFTSPL